MTYLLDSHTFIWQAINPDELSETVRDVILDETNVIHLRVVSLWEIQIKLNSGRLTVTSPSNGKTFPEFVREQLIANQFNLRPVSINHIYALADLPYLHRDPFDRLMITQSILHDLTFLTRDARIHAYDVKTLW